MEYPIEFDVHLALEQRYRVSYELDGTPLVEPVGKIEVSEVGLFTEAENGAWVPSKDEWMTTSELPEILDAFAQFDQAVMRLVSYQDGPEST